MNDSANPHDQDDELEGFETFEDDGFDEPAQDAGADDATLDADFQDIPDDVDADVFAEDQPAEAKPAKKTNWFNIGVAVVAVAVVGGLIWSKLGPQIMGGDVPPIPANINIAGSGPAQSEAAARQAVQPGEGPAGGGLLQNPDQFAALAQNPAPVAEAPAAPIADPFAALGDTPVTSGPQPAANVTPAPLGTPIESGVPMPAPIAAAPISETPVLSAADAAVQAAADASGAENPVPAPMQPQPELAAQPVMAQSPAQTQAQTPTRAPVVAGGDMQTQVSALEERLDALDAKIDSAVQRLENAAPADDARLTSIQNALERLESRLDTMASAPAASRTQPARATTDSAPARKKTAAAPKKTPKPKASAAKWDEPYSPSRTATPVASASGSGGWELRGAQPGRAVIAKGNDIREVGVGETVPGLGEITGVAAINGRWVVQGTQGRLSQ